LLEDFERSAVFLLSMHRLKTIVAVALLALWIPATSLCFAENAGLVANSDHCGGCLSSQTSPCCALASAAYKLDDHRAAVLQWLGNLVMFSGDTTELHPPLIVCLTGSSCESPPEVRSSWQFCARAAANPRAPSSVS
jgi:hypothetical protein